jgi:outer membrane lipoprotein-sorting protein
VRARLAVLALLVLLPAAPGLASEGTRAVEAFVARLAGVSVSEVAIEQTFTLYHPDGRHPQTTGEQRIWLKIPQRQRVEETVEGRRKVRVVVGERAWERSPDGRVYEVPIERDHERTYLIMPLRRTAADLLAEWRSLGVRDEVSHVTRVNGRPITVIGAQPGERHVPSVWLDAEHGVVRVVRREKLGKSDALVDLAYSEHRPITGGFAFPYRQEAFVDGKLVLLVIVRSVRVNGGVPDALFDADALRRGT